jgi:hypothetical protein
MNQATWGKMEREASHQRAERWSMGGMNLKAKRNLRFGPQAYFADIRSIELV